MASPSVAVPTLEIDPEFQALIPPLESEERAQLEENLKRDGCLDALIAWNGVLVDGHNRYEICHRLGIHFGVRPLEFSSREAAKIWIIRHQFGRRNLKPFVRAELALALKPLIAEQAKARQVETLQQGNVPVLQKSEKREPLHTHVEIARAADVSHDTIAKVERIKKSAAPEVMDAVRRGDISVNFASEVSALPAERQRAVMASGDIRGASKQLRAEKQDARRAERMANLAEVARGNAPLVTAERYPIIYADPPWRYEHAETENRAIENQYPTMALDEICALPLADVTTDDAVLFLWATSPKLAESMRVVESWGFTYRTCMVWVKDKIGMGYYARQRHELVLICTKGAPPTPAPADRPDSVVEGTRGEHSAKPDVFYDLIERMYPGIPKLEMFARRERKGWGQWGNQAA